MDVYVYQAAFLCGDCGEATRRNLKAAGNAPDDPEDKYSYDSDEYPKGPYDSDEDGSDAPDHCDQCVAFLENPLTADGVLYIREAIEQAEHDGRQDSIALTLWTDFYADVLEAD